MPENTATRVSGSISKLDSERQMAFGWGYVAVDKDGNPVKDHSGDVLDVETLEDPVYDYVLHSREGDVMHTDPVRARLVESVAFTPDKLEKMGAERNALPTGWWLGFKVDDKDVWKDVKDGTLGSFSIAGRGVREKIE